jgi:hypothetical protein
MPSGFVFTVAALLVAGCSDSGHVSGEHVVPAELQPLRSDDTDTQGVPGLRVMTRNVYVGTDVDKVIAAQSPEEVPGLVAEAFQLLQTTKFPERARSLAREIGWTRPHLIGLQEVSTIRAQRPGDASDGGTRPAETVLFDYLEVLMDELASQGLDYVVAAQAQNADVEVPMIVGLDPLAFDDMRLTDRDVILARSDVLVTAAWGQNYQARFVVPLGPGMRIEAIRGFAAVEATVGGRTYRFVSTHLEPAATDELLPIQLAQAEELIGLFANDSLPIVLVGDMNTWAPSGATYQLLADAGFADAWDHRSLTSPGFTCCHALDLANPRPDFDRRIDLILVRHPDHPVNPFSRPVRAAVVGDEFSNRTDSGLWPSDHGGVVAGMHVKGGSETAMVGRGQTAMPMDAGGSSRPALGSTRYAGYTERGDRPPEPRQASER